MLRQDVVAIAPTGIFLALIGRSAVLDAWPRWRSGLSAGLTLGIGVACAASLAEFAPQVQDQFFPPTMLYVANAKMAALPRAQAVVLFRSAGDKRNIDTVYNTDTAWPDDSLIIRARDLGARNSEIFRYYAEKQPTRVFYLYDESSFAMYYLGTARELAAGVLPR
jgi:hypothetical protein